MLGNIFLYYDSKFSGEILYFKLSDLSEVGEVAVSCQGGGYTKTFLDDLQSVELTEEWLIKLGFTAREVNVRHGNGYDYQPPNYKTEQHDFVLEGKEFFIRKTIYLLIPKGETEFIVEYTSGWCIYKNEWYSRCQENNVPVEIKYVHHLQNLYFALTEKALQIK